MAGVACLLVDAMALRRHGEEGVCLHRREIPLKPGAAVVGATFGRDPPLVLALFAVGRHGAFGELVKLLPMASSAGLLHDIEILAQGVDLFVVPRDGCHRRILYLLAR